MIKKSSLKEKIHSELLNGIIQGEYPLDTVFSEKALVEKYNVSKSPVREALIELCNENVLRSIPRYGYEIIKLTADDISNILSYRQILECGCLDMYWDLITQNDINNLKKLCNNTTSIVPTNTINHWSNNSTFHLSLMSIYRNEYMLNSLKSSISTLIRAYAQICWNKWHETVYHDPATMHMNFIAALENNDKALALEILRKDINEFYK